MLDIFSQNKQLKLKYEDAMKRVSDLENQLESQTLTLESAQLENRLKVKHISEQDIEIEALKKDLKKFKDDNVKLNEKDQIIKQKDIHLADLRA